ncbi:MAG: 4-alpha-glucanotransferase [Anaerolineae bacterium]|nr:4-alpha-glucanotransferase [Anaerolineae bacterium]MBL6966209.1 4-alpha-glucanotransferase [Anaerolineales bacterium]
MSFQRASGILLHPSSLPSPYGIGDIGPQAQQWIEFLAETGTGLWQILPLGPTGYGDSPYQCFSAFAGNPYLISPEALLKNGLLHSDDIIEAPNLPAEQVDFGRVIPFKLGILERSFIRFKNNPSSQIQQEFEAFQAAQTHWLPDYALFMAIKETQKSHSWVEWPAPLRDRNKQALQDFRGAYAFAIERHTYFQFLFFQQWNELRAYANQNGVQILGDMPIFVAHDSADVWAKRELFYLDEIGQPTVVAGVPPDYFSPTGQRWGNPIYRWDVHQTQNFSWWIDRFTAIFSMVDIIRLDHFRGFAGYWEIPGDEETAINGRWVPAPGEALFQSVEAALGELPIVAEDLGEITPDVDDLREKFGFPGMKILVFAFDGDSENPFLPHNYTPNSVVYTGTHDNDTTLGWYQRADEKASDFARRYLARDGRDITWDLIRAAWGSVAVFALAPMQDLLSLDNTARMNFPSTLGGNWEWRMKPDALTKSLAVRLREQNQLYGRFAKN